MKRTTILLVMIAYIKNKACWKIQQVDIQQIN